MKANELRIGNYVNLYGSQAIIIPNDFQKWFQNEPNWENKAFKPIPITEEWHLRFDIKATELNPIKNGIWITSEVDKQGCWVAISHGVGVVVVNIQYVHLYQNLYFALTGEELTITPTKDADKT